MLYNLEAVQNNIRNKDGRRVFYLGKGDLLNNEARDFLFRQGIPVLPAQEAKPDHYVLPGGGILAEKPEHMTHLQDNILVPKTHPRIAFRGAMDSLEAELLWCQLTVPELKEALGEILQLARNVIRWEVMNEPAQFAPLCGLDAQQLRSHSHRPQDFYGQPHFMPQVTDGAQILQLNKARCAARRAELAAVSAFLDGDGAPTRPDLLQILNRISSMIYILMIQLKAKQQLPIRRSDKLELK